MVRDRESLRGVNGRGRAVVLGRDSMGRAHLLDSPPLPSATDDGVRRTGSQVFAGLGELGRVRALNGNGLPFVDHPGQFLPKDPVRDKMLMAALRRVGGVEPIKPGSQLDYSQSKALYETARAYFEKTDPLMNTERWLAEFVEKNKLAYTDHDGKQYVMKGGIRKRIDQKW